MNILIVDDNSDNRKLLRAQLEGENHVVSEAGDGVEALGLLNGGEVDAVISDILMPRMDGYRLCQEIRKSVRFRGLPTILYSSTFTSPGDVSMALEKGANKYLSKPSNFRVLIAALREVVDTPAAIPALDGPPELEVLTEYNQQLVMKLEEKTASLERVNAELCTRSAQLAHLIAQSPAVIYSLIVRGDRLVPHMVSENLSHLLGFRAVEWCHLDWWRERLHPDDRDRAAAGVADTIRYGLWICEYRLRHKSGHYIWVEDIRRVIYDASNLPMEVAGVWTEITERKRAERALEESELKFRQLTDNAREVFWIANREVTEILYVSPAYEKVWGRSCQSLHDNPASLIDSIHPEDRDIARAILTSELRGEPFDAEFRIIRPDGAVRWIRDRGFPILTEEGEVLRVAGFAEDITERREMGEQLRQAQKMESIGQLAAGVAHDFNNMLAVIRGNAELALMGAERLHPGTRECVAQIIQATERAANLTRHLLVFGLKQVMRMQPLDLGRMVDGLAKMFSRIIAENIHIACDNGTGSRFALADPGMLEQSLLNLVVNARDAMPAGGDISIATRGVTLDSGHGHGQSGRRAGEFIVLSVADTGTGIAPEHLQRIFDPFYTTKEAGKGTGLGLAIVHGIVLQHQGWIEVETRVGAGTTIKIFLPAIATPQAAQELKMAKPAPRGGCERILLVEDETEIRVLTRRLLEGAGYSVLEAVSGLNAFEVWQDHAEKVDLLLTDIVMTDSITGRDLADRLRAGRPRLPVIFMSAYSADVVGRDTAYFERTKSQLLQKPFSSNALLEAVRQSLDEAARTALDGGLRMNTP